MLSPKILIAITILFASAVQSAPASKKELPFSRTLTHMAPAEMDQTLEQVLELVRASCNRDLSQLRADLKPLYIDTCMLPKLIPLFRERMAYITQNEISGLQSIDLTDLPMMERFKHLKSLTWQQAPFTGGNALEFVTKTLIYQLSIVKSFKAFLRLADLWNANQTNSNFHLYVYPKIMAYLEANSLFGVSLAYYHNIDCGSSIEVNPRTQHHCERYKGQIAVELGGAIARIQPEVKRFIHGLESAQSDSNRDLQRIQKINGLLDFLSQLKANNSVWAVDLVNSKSLQPAHEIEEN